MRKEILAILLVAILGLFGGMGFAISNDNSPKYHPLDLIEYEKCLETAGNVKLSLAEYNKDVKLAEYISVVNYCLPYRPKPIND